MGVNNAAIIIRLPEREQLSLLHGHVSKSKGPSRVEVEGGDDAWGEDVMKAPLVRTPGVAHLHVELQSNPRLQLRERDGSRL